MENTELIARHSPYSDEEKNRLSEEILDLMSDCGKSCVQACKIVGVKRSTFLRWVDVDKELCDQYTRARSLLEEQHIEEFIRIANEPVQYAPNGSIDRGSIDDKRLRSDAVKWALGRLSSTRDKQDNEPQRIELSFSDRLKNQYESESEPS